MKLVILLLLTILAGAGCVVGDNAKPRDVQRCEDRALSTCERIGYSGNDTCYLALAQDCSVEDASAAHELCISQPGAVEPCVLEWR